MRFHSLHIFIMFNLKLQRTCVCAKKTNGRPERLTILEHIHICITVRIIKEFVHAISLFCDFFPPKRRNDTKDI